MKRILIISLLMCSLLLTACDDVSIGVIGGTDGTTQIVVGEKKNDNIKQSDVKKYFREHYIDKHKLPVLDIDIDNPFVSDDRTLILDDSINNSLELMIYEYYRNIISGSYQDAKAVILDGSLLAATEAHENNFKNGIYYSRILIDEIEVVDKDDIEEISDQNKQDIVKLLNDLKMTEFAIIEVEKIIKFNEKALRMAPQVGDGEVQRYFLLGKKDNDYKIIEVYWEDFIND